MLVTEAFNPLKSNVQKSLFIDPLDDMWEASLMADGFKRAQTNRPQIDSMVLNQMFIPTLGKQTMAAPTWSRRPKFFHDKSLVQGIYLKINIWH